MSENITFTEIVDDPELKKKYFSKLEEPNYRVPMEWRKELKGLLTCKISLVGDITGPESYKTMLATLAELQAYRDRAALMLYHIKSLLFVYEQIKKKSIAYLERRYYDYLSALKDSLRKQTFAVALQPVEEGIENLEHLKDLATMVARRLDDINWTVKTSADIITEYFNNCKALRSFEQANI